MDQLSPQQLAVLKRATPEQLEFMLAFAGHGVTGRKIWGLMYKLAAAVGLVATMIASVLYVIAYFHGKP